MTTAINNGNRRLMANLFVEEDIERIERFEGGKYTWFFASFVHFYVYELTDDFYFEQLSKP